MNDVLLCLLVTGASRKCGKQRTGTCNYQQNGCVIRDLHNYYTIELKLIHIINATCLKMKDFALLAEKQILPYKYM